MEVKMEQGYCGECGEFMPDTRAGQHDMCRHCGRDVSIASQADAPTNMLTSADVTRNQPADALQGVWDAIGGPGRWHGANSIGQCVRAALIIAETKLAPELARATEEILALRDQIEDMKIHDRNWCEKADILAAQNQQLREVVVETEHMLSRAYVWRTRLRGGIELHEKATRALLGIVPPKRAGEMPFIPLQTMRIFMAPPNAKPKHDPTPYAVAAAASFGCTREHIHAKRAERVRRDAPREFKIGDLVMARYDLVFVSDHRVGRVVDAWEHGGEPGVDVLHPDGATTSGPESVFSRLGDDYPMPLPRNETRAIGVDVVPWPDTDP